MGHPPANRPRGRIPAQEPPERTGQAESEQRPAGPGGLGLAPLDGCAHPFLLAVAELPAPDEQSLDRVCVGPADEVRPVVGSRTRAVHA